MYEHAAEHRAGGGNRPTLHLDPTARRNLLGSPGRADRALVGQDELPRELIYAALRDADAIGYEALVLEGGEPLLHPSLPGILARARRLELHTTVVTNGTLLGQARRFAPVAPLIDHLAVEVHGEAATHDRLVRREGAYAQTVANLAVVREAGVPFSLSITLVEENLLELDAVLALAARQGAAGVRVRRPRVAAGEPEPAPLRELGAVLEAAAVRAARLGLTLDTGLTSQDELVLQRGRFVPRLGAGALVELAPVLRIEADGRILPLSAAMPTRLGLGSLRRGRLAANARAWLGGARAAEIAAACDRAWWSVVDPGAGLAVAWEDEVARQAHTAPRTRELAAVA